MTEKILLITGTVLDATKESSQKYQDIISICEKHTDNKIYSPLNTMQFKGNAREKYERAMNFVNNAVAIIAEVSIASTGQGMELQKAVDNNIPILLVSKKGNKVSSLLLGLDNVINHLTYQDSIFEIEDKIKDFLLEIFS